jgi:hypothetical protein
MLLLTLVRFRLAAFCSIAIGVAAPDQLDRAMVCDRTKNGGNGAGVARAGATLAQGQSVLGAPIQDRGAGRFQRPAVQRVQRAPLDVRVEDFDGTAIGRDVSTGIVHRIGIVVRRTCGMYLPDDVFDREGQELEALGPSQPSFVSSVQVRAGIPFHCL